MTFRRINDFSTDKPDMLDRELSQLEANVGAQFDVSEKTYAKETTVSAFMPVGAASIVALQPGEQRSIDTSQGNALAVLPSLAPANFGKRFTVIKQYSFNSVVVSCADSSVTHNRTTFPTLTAVGPKVFYCDSLGYYS